MLVRLGYVAGQRQLLIKNIRN